MILVANQTRCPGCGRFVYAIDDLFVTQPWAGIEQIKGFVPGIYHHACFRSSPHRKAFLTLDAAARDRSLTQDTAFVSTLARTPQFGLTIRQVTGEYTLWFLTSGRQLGFDTPGRWKELLTVIAGPDGPQPTPAHSRGYVRLRREEDGWELATRRLVPITADFAATDLARVRDYLSSRGIDPTRTPVELGVLCRQLGVKPAEVDCPLERLTGTVEWPDGSSEVTVQVESWHTVPLSGAELDSLRGFLRGLKQGGT